MLCTVQCTPRPFDCVLDGTDAIGNFDLVLFIFTGKKSKHIFAIQNTIRQPRGSRHRARHPQIPSSIVFFGFIHL